MWEIGQTGRMALPATIDRLTVHGTPSESEALHAQVTPRAAPSGLSFDAQVLDGKGRVYLELSGYRTAPLPGGLPDALVAPLRATVTGEAS